MVAAPRVACPPQNSIPIAAQIMTLPANEMMASQNKKPRGFWLFTCLCIILFAITILTPSISPRGWPNGSDLVLMALIPSGTLLLAGATSLPGRFIGIYGLWGSYCLLLGRGSDAMFIAYIRESGREARFFALWATIMFATWLLCRTSVLLRKRPSKPPAAATAHLES